MKKQRIIGFKMTDFVITKATLYRMGVGWFTAEGKADTDTVLFSLGANSLDDLLKTIIIEVDPTTEYVQNISFDTQENTSEFFAASKGLTGLLEYLRGKKVRITYKVQESKENKAAIAVRELNGLLIGFETDVEEEYGYEVPPLGVITVYDTSKEEIFIVPLKDLLQIYPLEEKTRAQLLDNLLITGGSYESEKEVFVRIKLSSNNVEKLKIHFLSEVPAWKISYRIHLLEKTNGNKNEGILLETWGIVDNKTQLDWINCSLQLSTETPVSFQYDLSTPHFLKRPTIERESTVEGTAFMEGIEMEKSFEEAEQPILAMAAPEAPRSRAKKMAPPPKKYQPPPSQATTSKTELGESVVYSLSNPVTIKKGQSAMVPLKHEKLPGEEKLLFNEENHDTHPFKVIYLKNTLTYSLDKAPASIFKHQHFLGETILPRINSGDDAFVPYALEKSVLVEHSVKTSTKKLSVGIEKRYQYQINKVIHEHEWVVKNKTGKTHKLSIYLPKQPDFVMENKQASDEEETTHWIINELIPANQTVKIKRTVSKEYKVNYSIDDLSPKQLEEVLKKSTLDDKTKKIIKELQEMKLKRIQIENEINSLENKLRTHEKRYQQILESLKVIKDTHEEERYRQKYLKQLDETKTDIEKIEETIEQKQKELKELEKNIRLKISELPV